MRRLPTAVLSLSLALSLAVPEVVRAEGVLLDRVVAVVNDEVVLQSELEVALRMSPQLQERIGQLGQSATPQQAEQVMREERANTLNDLIKNLLVKKEAARFQIEVSEGEVDRYLQSLAQQNNFQSIVLYIRIFFH